MHSNSINQKDQNLDIYLPSPILFPMASFDWVENHQFVGNFSTQLLTLLT